MPFEKIVQFILGKKGKTLQLELRGFMKKEEKELSKQAFSKQRQHLNPELFKVLNQEYVEDIYNEREIKRYKGHILLAVDGTTLELPNSNELKEHYGISQGRENSVGRVRARVMGVYDVLNEIMVKGEIGPFNESEKTQIEKHLVAIKKQYQKEKIIMIFDRYYFGIWFIRQLDKLGIKYVIRMRTNQYKSEKEQMTTNDEEVELRVRTNSVFYAESEEEKAELKRIKRVKTRITKLVLETGEEEHLASNLSKEEISEEEMKGLYWQRWGIEKAYDRLKNKLNIENFSSGKVIGIEQEFYAGILLYNMMEDIKSDTKVEGKEGLKYEYKVNSNIMVGIFKEEFIDIFTSKEEEIEARSEAMMEEIKKYLVPIKEGRKYPRRRMHSMNRYRSNLRRNV